MKKKFQLVLPLLTLPLLTSCPPSLYAPFEIIGDFNGRKFPLSEGFDMTIDFGLYDKHQYESSDFFQRKYMFLVSYGDEHRFWDKEYDEKWMPLYDITDDVRSCYWTMKGTVPNYYSKTANIHLDSDFFVSEHDSFTILLTSVDGYEPDKKVYTVSNIGNHLMSESLYYSIDEDSNVAVYRSYYWKRIHSSSSESSLSESSSDSLLSSTLESSSCDSLLVTSSEGSVIE